MWRKYLDLPRPVHVLCLGAFINRAGTMVLSYLALFLTESRGFTPAGAARIMGAFGVGSVIAAVVGGTLADRIGRKPVMVGALVGAAIMLTLVPHIHSELGMLGVVLGLAMAAEAYRPAGSAMLGDLTSPELRPRAYALFYVAINLGFAVGVSVGGWLVSAYSYETLFVVEAASAVTYALFIVLWLPETRPAGMRAAEAASPPSDAPVLGRWGALGHVLGNRPFVVFVVANLMIGVVFNQSFSTLPLYMAQVGISPGVYGLILAANGVLIVLGQLPLADRLSRADRAGGLTVGAVLMAVGFGLNGAFTSAAGLTGCVILWTLGEMFLASLQQPVVNDMAPAALRARYFGAFTLSFGLAMSLGPPLGGWILDVLGPRVLWALTAALGLTAAALLWSIRDHLRRGPVTAAVGGATTGSHAVA